MNLLSRAESTGVIGFLGAYEHAEQISPRRAPDRCLLPSNPSGSAVPFLSPGTLFPPAADGPGPDDVGSDDRLSASRPARRSRHLAVGARPRVLVIDDQARSDGGLVALVKLLELDGFDVECVQAAAEGLRRALARGYDLIILDLKLPDRPGLWVLEAIRASGLDTPVVVITGWYLEDGHEDAARALGVYDYLHKPVFADDLAPLLWQAVGGRDAPTGTLSHRGAASRSAASAAEAAEAPPPVDSAAMGGIVEGASGRYGPVADEFASRQFPRLRHLLRGRFPRASDDSVTCAINRALLDYLERVRSGDPPLDEAVEGYLHTAAKRNLIDIHRAERRRQLSEAQYAKQAPLVTEPPAVAFARESAELWRRIRALASTQAEESVLLLWFEDAEFERIVDALGCSHLTAAEQRAEVKRFKDRIRRRARRSRR